MMVDEIKLHHIARIYSEYVYNQAGTAYQFLSWTGRGTAKYKMKMEQLSKLSKIIEELQTTVEEYIKIQNYQQLSYWEHRGVKFVPLGAILTDGAKVDFWDYKKKEKKGEIIAHKVKKEDKTEKIKKSIVRSADALKRRLAIIGQKLDKKLVVGELERMAKAGFLSVIYLISHPLRDEIKDSRLREEMLSTMDELTKEDRETIKQVRLNLNAELSEDERGYI